MDVLLKINESELLKNRPPISAAGFDFTKNRPDLLLEFKSTSTKKLDAIYLRIWELALEKKRRPTPKVFEYGFSLNNRICMGYVQHECLTYSVFNDGYDIATTEKSNPNKIEKIFLKNGANTWPTHDGELMEIIDYAHLTAEALPDWEEGIDELFFLFRSQTNKSVFKIITENMIKY